MLIKSRRPRKWKFLHRHMVFASSNSTLYDYDRIWKRQKLVQAHGLCSQQLNVMSLYDCLLASLSLWTAQSPGQVSVIDVISVISGKDANQAAEQLRYLVTRCREVQEHFMYFRFSSRSAKNACHQCPRHRRGHYAPNKRTQPRLEVRWQSSCADGCAESICLESI